MPNGNVIHSYQIGKEVQAWGGGGTLLYDVGVVNNIDKNASREPIVVQGIGDIEPHSNNAGIEEGTHTVTFSYQHGRFFEFIIGTASHATSGSDVEHTFTVSDTPASLYVEAGSNISAGDVGFTFLGQLVESAELSIALNGVLEMSVTVRGKAPQSVDTSIATHTTSSLVVFPHNLVTVGFNGTNASFVQNFRVSFRKTLNPTDGMGTVAHQFMTAADFRIEFSGTLAFNASTYHTHFVSNNLTAITFTADNTTAFGSGKRAMELALNDIELTGFKETVRVGDLTFIELSGIAKLNTLKTYDNITSASWINAY